MIQRFDFTESDFQYISKLVLDHAGIFLNNGKKELVYGRLVKRLRFLELTSFKEYCEMLEHGQSEEFTQCVNAITTNVTSFFRENHHFEFMENDVLPKIRTAALHGDRKKLNIWSAGCSTGEEPYSVAITISDEVENLLGWEIDILATDLDFNVLDQARKGIYKVDYLDGVSPQRRKSWFLKGKDENAGLARVVPKIRDMVHFEQLNLVGPWNITDKFDLIFCRNVMIYFDKETRHRLLQQFAERLVPDGCLFVGHSESLSGLTDVFKPVGSTIYRKIS